MTGARVGDLTATNIKGKNTNFVLLLAVTLDVDELKDTVIQLRRFILTDVSIDLLDS